jgi:hypothetical protein
MLKRGTMTPVIKKNKDRQNPANYGGITVTKIFTKIIQSRDIELLYCCI